MYHNTGINSKRVPDKKKFRNLWFSKFRNLFLLGLTYSTLSLLSTVVFLLVATHLNGWKLDKKYGIILMLWYIFFISFASLYELNVFGFMNLPECPTLY